MASIDLPKNMVTESKEIKDSDTLLYIPSIPTLIRYHKALCPLRCNMGLSWGYSLNNHPKSRDVYHPECRRHLYLIQKRWCKKVKLEKLKKITRVLMRMLSSDINHTDFIDMIYKFL